MSEEISSAKYSSNTVNSERFEASPDDLEWRRFWYDLKRYIDRSWMISMKNQPVINPRNSQCLWNATYPLLRRHVGLYQSSFEGKPESFWAGFLPMLVHAPVESMKVAGIAYYADVNPANINKIYAKDPYYREAVQLGRSLSLGARCQLFDEQPVVDESTVISAGLYFLYHALKPNCLEYWLRARICFDKNIILQIEQKSPAHLFSDSTSRSFQRLWNKIYFMIKQYNSIDTPGK